jgi:ParB-like chromosome segregation protein Spo0J
MDETLIWFALIGAVAYIIKPMLPNYYELIKARQSRLDTINDAIDDNERTMLAIGRKVGDLQSDIAGYLTRLDDLNETVNHNCLRLAVLEEQMWKAKTAAPENEVSHD